MIKQSIYLLLLAMVMAFVGCSTKSPHVYDGDVMYEWSAEKNGQCPAGNLLYKESDEPRMDSICVQLIKPSSSEVVVNYRLADEVYYIKSRNAYVIAVPEGISDDDVEAVASSFVYNEDFAFVRDNGATYDPATRKGTVVVPAGEMFAYVRFTIKKKGFHQGFFVLEDGVGARANVPTSILQWKMPVDRTYLMSQSFDLEIPSTWTMIDKDGDGYGFYYFYSSKGFGAAFSDSYNPDIESALTPEDYLVSPAIALDAPTANFYLAIELAASGSSYFEEAYKVVVSEDPITEETCYDAITMRDYTTLTEANSGYQFSTELIDLSRFAGKTVYVGVVHGNCSDQDAFLIKSIKVYSE